MTTATAQATPNIAFIKLSQWNTILGDCKAGFARKKAKLQQIDAKSYAPSTEGA